MGVAHKLASYALVMAVTAFFAIAWGLLLREHVDVGTGVALTPAFDDLLDPDETERSSAWGIYFGPLPVGRSRVTVAREEGGLISLRSRTSANLGPALRFVTGKVGKLDVDFTATISPLRGLHHFSVQSELLDTSLQGTVNEGEVLVTGHIGPDRIRTRAPFEQNRLLGQVLAPLSALPPPRKRNVGKSWPIEVVNPIAGEIQRVLVRLERYKTVTLDGEGVDVFEHSFTTGTSRWTSWVTADGETLVQGTPFGLTLRREPLPLETLAELSSDAPAPPAAEPPRP
jgi:hypothetical protein